MGPRAQGPWAHGPTGGSGGRVGRVGRAGRAGPKWMLLFFTITQLFWKKTFFEKKRPFIEPPSLKLGAKMTANGLSSYELFVKIGETYAFFQ